MKALVTGSTGLIGTNLVKLLVERGYEVVALARDSHKAATVFAGLPVRPVIGDVRRLESFAEQLDGCNVLFHTAAYFREYYKPGEHSAELESTNVRATLGLLEEADRRGVARTIYVSSAGVVGKKPDGSAGDEEGPVSPSTRHNFYYKSKLEVERELLRFGEDHRMPVVLILPAFTFGPEDRAPTPSGELVLAFLRRQLPVIVPGGMTVVDARDVARTMEAAVHRGKPGERYIAAAQPLAYAELLQILERVSGVPGPTRKVPKLLAYVAATVQEARARLGGPPPQVTRERLRALFAENRWSAGKAERELGVSFRPFEQTLRDEVRWYVDHGFGSAAYPC